MKKAIIKTTVIVAMLCVTVHFYQRLASIKQSYHLLQTALSTGQTVQPPWF